MKKKIYRMYKKEKKKISMSCKQHSDCPTKGSYCTTKNECHDVSECFIMKDSNTGKCPVDKCSSLEDCKETAYCNGDCYCGVGQCFPRKVQGMDVCKNENLRDVLGFADC